jgi:endonuclease III
MTDPQDIIKFDRTDEQLEHLALFLIAVAGKNADTTVKCLNKFMGNSVKPFAVVRHRDDENTLNTHIKNCGFGCHTRLTKAFADIAKAGLNLKTCSREDLLKIHGIGMKSANCFLSWTRKGTKLAMLDTHLMKFIRNDLGYVDAPKSTPSSKKQYEKWEKIFLDHCKEKKVDPHEIRFANLEKIFREK